MNKSDSNVEIRRNRKAEVEKFQREHQQPIYTLRRVNLQALAELHGASNLSVMLGYRQASFLSQMLGAGWNRVVSEKSAREYELALNLPVGYLDKPLFPDSAKPPVAPVNSAPAATETIADAEAADVQALSLAIVEKTIRALNTILKTENTNVSTDQYGRLLRSAVVDAAEHGFAVRESHVKQMLELIK